MSTDPTSPTPEGSKFALIVLVALVVLSPWPFGSAHLRTTQAIAVLSLATALVAFLWDGWRRQLEFPPRAILWPLVGLWALAVFQLIPIPEALHRALAPGSAAVWHPDVPAAAAVLGPGPHPISLYPEATRRWHAFATGVIALGLAAAPALRDRRLLLRASTAVVGGAVLVALYGFVARLVFGNKLYGVWSVPTIAPFGPFVSKNHFAGYVEVAALLAVGLATGLADEARHGPGWLSWIESHRSKWVVAAWSAALVLVLAVPVSLSRGGVVSLCAGLLAFAGLRLWTRGPSRLSTGGLVVSLVVALLVAVAIGVALPAEARARVFSLAGITSDQSGAYRIGVWRDTLRLIGSSPMVGSGFGAYADALPRFKTTAGNLGIEHAENDVLELLAEGGVVAAVLAAGGAIVLFLSGLRGVGTEEHRLARALLAAARAGGVVLAFHSGLDFNLHIPSNALMGGVIVSLAAALGRAASATVTVRRPPAVPSLSLLVLVGSLLAAIWGPWSQTPRQPVALTRAVVHVKAELRRSAVSSQITSLLKVRPAQATAWVQLGWLRLNASREEATALAKWGSRLDPRHEALTRAAALVGESSR